MRKRVALLAGAAIIAALAAVVATAGVGSAAETVNWSAQGTMPNAGTSTTPAMTNCNGITYMVWKGVDNDTRMFFSSLSGDGVWAPQQIVGGGGGTNTAPTVTCDWNEDIVVAWKGLGSDEHVWYTTAQVESSVDQPIFPLQWSSQQVAGGALTDLPPSLAVVPPGPGGTLYLGWKGTGGDTNVYISTLPSFTAGWQGLGAVPGVSTVRSPTLTVGLNLPFQTPFLSVVWPEAGSQALRYVEYVNGRWTGAVGLQGGSGAAPAVTEGPHDGFNPPDNLIAWQGSGSDTRIFYSVDQNGAGWQAQQLVTNGGPTTTGLATADYVQCPNGICNLITAYVAWKGPQEQIEFVHGVY